MMPRERMYDYMARRDGRRSMRRGDMARGRRDMRGGYDMGDYNRGGYSERDARRDYTSYSSSDYARGGRDYERGGQSDRGSVYPFDVSGMFARYDGNYDDMARGRGRDYGDYARGRRDYASYDMARGRRDYGYDYGTGDECLTPEELDYWMKDLMDELDEKDKPMFKMENIIKRAKDMGVEFDKFTPEEFHVVVLMCVTDYCKTLGMSNIDLYLKLAKDWLLDKDSALKGSEKLAAYRDYIVMGM